MRPTPTDVRSERQRKAKAEVTAEEADIAELQNLVRACGGRVAQKKLAELEPADAIKALNKQLDELGMPTCVQRRPGSTDLADVGHWRRRRKSSRPSWYVELLPACVRC